MNNMKLNLNVILTVFCAMCPEEYQKTIATNKFSWKTRHKFFSENLDFIINRVRDGKFSHSAFKTDKYKHLVKFVVKVHGNNNPFVSVSNHELMLSVRKQSLVEVISVETVLYK